MGHRPQAGHRVRLSPLETYGLPVGYALASEEGMLSLIDRRPDAPGPEGIAQQLAAQDGRLVLHVEVV